MKTTFLENTCELITDGTHYTPPDVGEGFPFLTVKDMSTKGLDFVNCSYISSSEYAKADAGNSSPRIGDVLFSKDGTVGKVHVVSEKNEFAILSSIAILRPKKDVLDSNYFGHILRSPTTLDQAIRRKTGSAIRRIILKDLKRVKIPLPPLEEQKRIAAILDKADAIRRSRKEAIRLTEELLRSTFLDMFGDPVTNPKGWNLGKLSDVCKKISDGTHHSPPIVSEGIPYITAKHLKKYGLDFHSNPWFVAETEHKKIYARCNPEKGDVLYIKDGATTGIAAINNYNFEFSMLSSLALLKVGENLTSEYLCDWLNSENV
ncbi:MAG: hypothetical protein HC764_22760, partial [Pleurocapsa sp. CRU_1_2]|nr:hypothetical protein [Pleurocapsa sp. CRU_1_2]